jgi:hypothetical protein
MQYHNLRSSKIQTASVNGPRIEVCQAEWNYVFKNVMFGLLWLIY